MKLLAAVHLRAGMLGVAKIGSYKIGGAWGWGRGGGVQISVYIYT